MDSRSENILDAQGLIEMIKFLSSLSLGSMGFVSVAYWMTKENDILGESVYLFASLSSFFLCFVALFISMTYVVNKMAKRVSVYSSPIPIGLIAIGWFFFLAALAVFGCFWCFKNSRRRCSA
ncbi:MAG TPA: hypothetical protein ENJ17_03310 [Gammaproteobacteria bacterium]|nr:hypothetical protein [Gammaproteobacteria bacterium]